MISRPEEDSPVNLLQKTGGTGVRVIAKARWKGNEAGQNQRRIGALRAGRLDCAAVSQTGVEEFQQLGPDPLSPVWDIGRNPAGLLKPPRFRGYSPGWRRKSYRRPRAGSVVVDEDLAGRVWAVLAGNRRQDRSRGTCSPSLPAPTLVGGGRAASCGRAAAPASGNRECRFRSRADEPTVRAALLLQLRSGSIFAPSWIGAANLRRRLGAANCRRSGSRTSRRRRARAAPNARG